MSPRRRRVAFTSFSVWGASQPLTDAMVDSTQIRNNGFVYTSADGVVDLVAPWRQPHHFTTLRTPFSAEEPRFVFTYMLATTELTRALAEPEPTPTLFARLGAEWVSSPADSGPGSGKSALSRFVKEKAGIANPGQDSAPALLGLEHSFDIPEHVLEDFVSHDLRRLTEFADLELAPLVRELERAADAREPPDPAHVKTAEGHGLEAARRFLEIETYTPSFKPVPLRSPDGRAWWGLCYENLAQRISAELFELFTARPRLRRCRFCNRVFVPRTRNEGSCRAYLWPLGQKEAIEFCDQEAVEAYNRRATDEGLRHERERKRLHIAWRREQRRSEQNGSGQNSPRAQRKKKELDDYMAAHEKQRGPRPRTEPDVTSG